MRQRWLHIVWCCTRPDISQLKCDVRQQGTRAPGWQGDPAYVVKMHYHVESREWLLVSVLVVSALDYCISLSIGAHHASSCPAAHHYVCVAFDPITPRNPINPGCWRLSHSIRLLYSFSSSSLTFSEDWIIRYERYNANLDQVLSLQPAPACGHKCFTVAMDSSDLKWPLGTARNCPGATTCLPLHQWHCTTHRLRHLPVRQRFYPPQKSRIYSFDSSKLQKDIDKLFALSVAWQMSFNAKTYVVRL